MKIKALVAGVLAAASFGASAATVFSGPVLGSSFANVNIGTISVSALSDLTGSVFAANTVTYTIYGSPVTLTLDHVTFSSATVGSLVDTDASATGFSFHNVAAGYYDIIVSGSLVAGGQVPQLALLGATYTVTAVPEPETYGMMLGGLAAIGAIARRKAKKVEAETA